MGVHTNKITFKQINQLAIPAIFSGIAESLITLTDIAMIGNIQEHSVESLAAAGLVGSFIAGVIWIFAQTETSISSIVSVSLGAGRLDRLKKLVPQVLFFNFLLGVLVLALSLFLSQFIFELYNARGLVLDLAVDYFQIRIFGFPLTLISLTLFGTFRGRSEEHTSELQSRPHLVCRLLL